MTSTHLKAFRNKMGLTQRAFAAWIGAKYRTVVAWETNQNPVPHWVNRRILEEFPPRIELSLDAAMFSELKLAARSQGKSFDELVSEVIREIDHGG